MALIDRLLARSTPPGTARKRKTIVRVLLDDAGHVQDVVLKMSGGDPATDAHALDESARCVSRAASWTRARCGAGTSSLTRPIERD
ncbi:energy transducer TonB [Caballeronia sp. LZ008]|uniref:energy transducer TonB n=1 Tax=unclassified Caballeronia TaxID=2646786 RepID=UPI00202896B0|nr:MULTISPECIES: energy transducer TonB [unclassified Caballeronia]MDR5792544.1 energy transducer TonB [Caballeronia sp. LZ008]